MMDTYRFRRVHSMRVINFEVVIVHFVGYTFILFVNEYFVQDNS
jgi:hypothetical protein